MQISDTSVALTSFKKYDFEKSYNLFHNYKSYFLFDTLLEKSLFPNSIQNIRKMPVLSHHNNFEGELAFIVHLIIKNKKKLHKFLLFEKQYQKSLLNENYDKCLEIINEVNNEISFSFWGIENEFNILQKTGGIEKNWTYKSQVTNVSNDYIVNLLIHFYSKKAEDETSVLNYLNEIILISRNLNKNDGDFLNFILGNKKFIPNNFTYILNSISNYSLIDLYYSLLTILNQLSVNKEYQKSLNYILKLLTSNIIDERITRLKEINPYSLDKIEIRNELSIIILDEYSKGNYDRTIELAKKFLKNNLEKFFIYEVYVKSLLQSKKDFEKTNINIHVDFILENLFHLMIKNEKYHYAKEYLLKLGLTHSKVNFFIQLNSFVTSCTDATIIQTHYNEYFIYCEKPNPQSIHLNITNRNKHFKGDYKKNLSIYINYLIFTKNITEIKSLNIPELKKILYEARINFHNRDSSSLAVSILQKLFIYNLDNFTKDEVLQYYTSCLRTGENFSALVDLIVKSYYENALFVERIDLELVINLIIKSNYNLEWININFPILFYLHNVDSYYQYVSLEMFLYAKNIEKPSNINYKDYNVEKLVLLLEKIASIETLNNFYLLFNNDEEVIDERINILNILKKIKPENLVFYDEEISLIKQKTYLRKLLNNLNDGRIYYNFYKTVENFKSSYLLEFNRLKHIQKYTETKELDIIDYELLLKKYLDQFRQDQSVLKRADFVSFKNLYIEIQENYLFSNEYGLNGILSTRFRHGEVENKIRNIFSSNFLISTKDYSSTYTDISYWEMYQAFDSDEKFILLQEQFKIFSEKIDSIIDNFIHKRIQINSNRTFNNEFALFDFSISDTYIWIMFNDFEKSNLTYNQFIEYLNEIVRVKTESLLGATIQYINANLKNFLLSEITSFQKNILEFYKVKDFTYDFNQKINFIKTSVEKELLEISKWFKINNTIDSTSLHFKTIIDLAVESFGLSINYENIDLSRTLFDGADYYIDIIRILIDNAIKYSFLDIDNLKLVFKMESEDITYKTDSEDIERTYFKFSVQNNFNPIINTTKLEENFKQIIYNWNNNLDYVNTEGGSGFKKIAKLLKYDLKAKTSSLKFSSLQDTLTISIEYEI